MTVSVLLRPVVAGDEGFLFRVYLETRRAELQPLGWSPEQVEGFLRGQFAAQLASYALQFPDSAYSVVVRDGVDVGRILIHRAEDEVRLVDLALLPEHRGRGTGTILLRAVQAEAALADLPLRLCVQVGSRAVRLYRRLGFAVIGRDPLDLAMEWLPPDAPLVPAAGPTGSAARPLPERRVWEGVVGSEFLLEVDGGGLLPLTLQSVEARPALGRHEQFSLLFLGPAAIVLPQRIYGLRHAGLGRCELFLVPIRRDADGTCYEAAFSRALPPD